MPEEVVMTGGNVAHQEEAFGDEDDMLFITMQFSDNRSVVIDMCDCGSTLKLEGKEEHFLVQESQEDDDRTGLYQGTEMDSTIMHGFSMEWRQMMSLDLSSQARQQELPLPRRVPAQSQGLKIEK